MTERPSRSSSAESSSEGTRHTRRRVLATGVVAAAVVVATGEILVADVLAVTAAWTVPTVLVVAGLWWYTYANAAENSSGDTAGSGESDGGETARAYATLGLPTGVTLFRGTVIAGVAGVAAVAAVGGYSPVWAWAAAVGYGVAAALDAVDGFLARRLDRVTRLGGRLDTAVDAFGLLAAPLAGVVLGELAWWYLSVGAARYVFVAGKWWRDRTDKPTFDLPPRASRRVLAGLQMAVVPLALAPGVFDAWMPLVTGVAAGGLLLGFGRDWLYVSGRLRSAATRPQTSSAEH
ncbi:putative CDP-diacylglycerol--glycerol-3-phosphate 3-phosphatidyl-transferase [Haloferax mucosum ATCC BAA-1512]|uniref:Putative CDP-diacylglycerol--glycerol-3-phosphate 3-phosphatidyl-transferase n=1 Tax=Haloferax mucosum ATCC BAA-1512 TaxID=662479 RepID=M0I646_9EURY|nr:CDP-alcohol phosphatidyltransferase family protein [Haloferax mucosum]ELZ91432.1 putative CDP-diacylglycerol--glycerol-3-phosphate 3-phosphatidyl-transferase [Haloferax mucosum ATCC BAA-1512]